MTQIEINTFIETMEEIGDVWSSEQVKDIYGDIALKDALSDRKLHLDQFTAMIGKMLNS